jgi:hypothetical protein
MNSNPARAVSNIHDQPVNDMGNAPMEPSFIFAIITTNMPHVKMNKSIAVDLGIPKNNNVIVVCSSWKDESMNGTNSNGVGLKTTIDV